MASDFSVIKDLTSLPQDSGPQSPAHFNTEEREAEFERWDDPHIETLSFATVGNRPFRFDSGRPAPVWDLGNLFTYPEISKDLELSEGTDVFYRLCYRACAGGPFHWPGMGGEVTRRMNDAPQGPLELWDNDGIVNTASMLWPGGDNVLVAGDHLDIVGHYKLVQVGHNTASGDDRGAGREYRAYDFLESAVRFSDKTFEQVWTEVFNFALGKCGRSSSRAHQRLPMTDKSLKQNVSA
jgi:hypothetical protein